MEYRSNGKKHSPETIEKMKQAQSNRISKPFSEEHRANLAKATKAYWDRKKQAKEGKEDGSL